jgi:hypothetical protein
LSLLRQDIFAAFSKYYVKFLYKYGQQSCTNLHLCINIKKPENPEKIRLYSGFSDKMWSDCPKSGKEGLKYVKIVQEVSEKDEVYRKERSYANQLSA